MDSKIIGNTNCQRQSNSLSVNADATFQRKVAHLMIACEIFYYSGGEHLIR
ncbi:MAG: hypothetical protein LBK82_09030 [Planctomycetaceae bacterium]|nr:hypothetical protein [Planctomycetaceae bacterium]